MAYRPNPIRFLLWLIALAGVVAGCVVLVTHRPPLVTPGICKPLPAGIKKMGRALAPPAAAAALGLHSLEEAGLLRAMQPGDTVHEFETEVMREHLIMRGRCYIDQTIGWIR